MLFLVLVKWIAMIVQISAEFKYQIAKDIFSGTAVLDIPGKSYAFDLYGNFLGKQPELNVIYNSNYILRYKMGDKVKTDREKVGFF